MRVLSCLHSRHSNTAAASCSGLMLLRQYLCLSSYAAIAKAATYMHDCPAVLIVLCRLPLICHGSPVTSRTRAACAPSR